MYTKWNLKILFKLVSNVLMYSSFTLIIPLVCSLMFSEPIFISLLYSIIFIFTFLISFIWSKSIKWSIYEREYSLKAVHYLIIVCLVWLIYALFASIPFILIAGASFINSYFEVISALTTTGLTMFPNLNLVSSLIFWRSFLSWIGGVGIIIIAYFGLTRKFNFSNRILTAEGHDRLRPNFKNTVIDIWKIYFVLTIIGIILLYVFGMGFFDSINYSMSAISTTGMNSSSLGRSLLFSPNIQLVLTFLMLLGATSFVTHYNAIKRKNIFRYFKEKQFLFMLLIILIGFLLAFTKLFINYDWISVIFNTVSIATCGGLTNWSSVQIIALGPFVLLIFILLMFIGGSSNSTAGGIKVDRFILFIKSISWKIKSLLLPDIARFSKKFNDKVIHDKEISTIYFFILIYLLFIILGTLVLVYYNFGFVESLFEVISAQSNVGFSSGIVSQTMPLLAKIMLIINMWVGRLEIIPILAVIGMIFQKRKL